MTDRERLADLLSRQPFIVLAVTLDDGRPWAVPVKVKRWEPGAFEWDSRLDTLHSQVIEVRPATAVTIYEKSDEAEVGFYFAGKAELLEDRGDGYGRYRFRAERAWVNDETYIKREFDGLHG